MSTFLRQHSADPFGERGRERAANDQAQNRPSGGRKIQRHHDGCRERRRNQELRKADRTDADPGRRSRGNPGRVDDGTPTAPDLMGLPTL
jgi:hypothetical protein